MSVEALDPTILVPSQEEQLYTNKKEDTLGKDQFLTLLVAQLKHQDPLNPLDGTDFTAQLAQFSSLEQLFSMNESLQAIQEGLGGQDKSNLLDYIGKTVKTDGDTILVKDGSKGSASYSLEGRANVVVHVFDDQGQEIRKLYPGWQDSGEYDLAWDGKDELGQAVADGVYTFEVEAIDSEGSPVEYSTQLSGEVTGVTYQNGIPYLMVGDKALTTDNIVEVRQTADSDAV